jgi:hypothetical protein
MIGFIDAFVVQSLLIKINCKNSQSIFCRELALFSFPLSFYDWLFSLLYFVVFPFSCLSFSHNNSPTTYELPIPILKSSATKWPSLYTLGSDSMKNVSRVIKNACWLVRYLAIDVLLLRANFGHVFPEPLPRNGHNIYQTTWRHRICWSSGNACRLVCRKCTVRIYIGTPAVLTEVLRDFPEYLQVNAGLVSRWGHDPFLPNPLQFIIYQSSYHSILYSLAIGNVVTKHETLHGSHPRRLKSPWGP